MRQSWLPLPVACLVVLSLAGLAAQQKEDVVYEAGPGVTLPKVVKEAKPSYTPGAMSRRVQGRVQLKCVVTTDGKPTKIEVLKGLDEDLDAAAIAALEQWLFEAGMKDGKPVPVRITVEMTFTLKK